MTPAGPTPTHEYRPDIDGLRAVAVWSVVIFHAFPQTLQGGFIGVDVFFVISGYLISTIIFKQLARGRFSFVEFYGRRIRRIFPALILVLGTCYAVGWFALLADEYQHLGKHIVAGAFFLSNFTLWSEAGYFDSAAELKPLLHLWSLSIEEQFYIVFPLLSWVLWSHGRCLFLFITAAATASFLLNLWGVKSDPISTFYMPQTRIWELLCGSLLAWTSIYRPHRHAGTDRQRRSDVVSVAAGTLLLVGFFAINKNSTFPGLWAVIPVSAAALLIYAGPGAWVNRRILASRMLVWFGLISFPLYLWHWPLLSLARVMENGPLSIELRSGIVALSVLLAWLTYRYIERPIRGGLDVRLLKVASLVAGVIGMAMLGGYTFMNAGLSHRISGETAALNDLISQPYPDRHYVDCKGGDT